LGGREDVGHGRRSGSGNQIAEQTAAYQTAEHDQGSRKKPRHVLGDPTKPFRDDRQPQRNDHG
jgi:hypothetical protein